MRKPVPVASEGDRLRFALDIPARKKVHPATLRARARRTWRRYYRRNRRRMMLRARAYHARNRERVAARMREYRRRTG